MNRIFETKLIDKMKLKYIIVAFLITFSCCTIGAQSWQQIVSVEDVCKAYPEKMDYIFKNLNLDYPGLENVKAAYTKGNVTEACNILLQHYKSVSDKRFVYKPQPEVFDYPEEVADRVLNDTYTFQLVEGKVPRLEDGHLKWDYNGPEDDIEWAWALNRHYPISYILPCFFETKNKKYGEYIDYFIKDWIIESWPYPAKKSSTAMWRGLEVSFRVKVWSQVFYGLMDSGLLSPATQLLILSSLPDHAHYAREFHAQNNWLTMEISGLAKVAASWPEFKQAEEWMNYSVSTMSESLKGQVYPDGAQSELTSSYHWVALRNFELFSDICKQANKELPKFFNKTLENMYNYLALTIRPDGFGLLNNDADRNNNEDKLLSGGEKFERPDWKYMATNGNEGTEPKDGPSFVFPWAGHLISRSAYDKNAHWSLFDIGPWGSGHQHNDKLHLSISAYGRDLLVDGGRYAYRGEVAKKFRGYARGTESHNTILIDGKGQKSDVAVVDEPLTEKHFKITPEFDYAWNSFDKYYDVEGVKHNRSLLYVRNNFWVVVDKVETLKPRKIETLWHWHPDCEVENGAGNVVSSRNEKGNLKIIPLGKTQWQVDLIKGQDEPVQGWYSAEYNQYEPNVCAIYSAHIKRTETFVWLLLPFNEKAPNVKGNAIEESAEGIGLEIADMEAGYWKLFLPHSNSENVTLEFTE